MGSDGGEDCVVFLLIRTLTLAVSIAGRLDVMPIKACRFRLTETYGICFWEPKSASLNSIR